MKTIPLSKGRANAIVDDDDYEELSLYSWQISSAGYAQRFTPRNHYRRKSIQMHRQILKTPEGMSTDHINGNPLDNRKSNLRICTHQQNCQAFKKHRKTDRSPYRGVYLRYGKRWYAYFKINRKQKYLGSYDTPEEAARRWNEEAKIHYGVFASLNNV